MFVSDKTTTRSFMKNEKYNFVKTILLKTMSICLDDQGIVHVTYLHGQIVDKQDKEEELRANLEITNGKKHPFIFSFENYVTITKEAKEHSIKIEKDQPYLAVAVVVQNLAYQLMADFYFKFYKPKIAYKVFKSEEKAVNWLLEQKKDFEDGNPPQEKNKKFLFF